MTILNTGFWGLFRPGTLPRLPASLDGHKPCLLELDFTAPWDGFELGAQADLQRRQGWWEGKELYRKKETIRKDERVLLLHLMGLEGCHWEGDGSSR